MSAVQNFPSLPAYIEPAAESQGAYYEYIHNELKKYVWTSGCSSWFNNRKAGAKVFALFPGAIEAYKEMLGKTDWSADYVVGGESKSML